MRKNREFSDRIVSVLLFSIHRRGINIIPLCVDVIGIGLPSVQSGFGFIEIMAWSWPVSNIFYCMLVILVAA